MDGMFTLAPRLAPGAETATPSGLVLFDEDFDAPAAAPDARPEVIAATFTAAELAAAREAAWHEGRDLGLAEAAAAQDAAMEAAARSVAAQIAAVRAEAHRETEAAAAAVAELLLDALGALFPALCAAHGPGEAEAVLRAILPGLAGAPALTLRANPSLLDRLGAELARLDPDLAGRTRLVGSEMMAPGDIGLIWQHGQASRDAKELWAAVAAALALGNTDGR